MRVKGEDGLGKDWVRMGQRGGPSLSAIGKGVRTVRRCFLGEILVSLHLMERAPAAQAVMRVAVSHAVVRATRGTGCARAARGAVPSVRTMEQGGGGQIGER